MIKLFIALRDSTLADLITFSSMHISNICDQNSNNAFINTDSIEIAVLYKADVNIESAPELINTNYKSIESRESKD